MSAVITSIGFCPTKSVTGRQNRRDHVGHACFIYSFEPVIAASKQLPYEVCPEAVPFFLSPLDPPLFQQARKDQGQGQGGEILGQEGQAHRRR